MFRNSLKMLLGGKNRKSNTGWYHTAGFSRPLRCCPTFGQGVHKRATVGLEFIATLQATFLQTFHIPIPYIAEPFADFIFWIWQAVPYTELFSNLLN